MVTFTGSPLGSVIRTTDTSTSLWFGGHSSAGLATALRQSGATLPPGSVGVGVSVGVGTGVSVGVGIGVTVGVGVSVGVGLGVQVGVGLGC